MKKSIILGLLTIPVLCSAVSLEEGFRTPPDSAKPHTWWHWMNNNVTREGITADLEAMKSGGLGGAQIFSIDWFLPNGPVQCASPEWFALVQHAVQEAKRLGLELSLQNGPGWSSSGGPWVPPEHGMKRLVTCEQAIQGPAHFSASLPNPAPQQKLYRDIAVLAFPTPRGESSSMKAQAPKFSINGVGIDGSKLMDGDPNTSVALPLPPGNQKPSLQIEFAQPFAARTLTLRGIFSWDCELQVSDDGQTFKTVSNLFTGGGGGHLGLVSGIEPLRARFYRIYFWRLGNYSLSEVNLSDRLSVPSFPIRSAGWRYMGFWVSSDYLVSPDSVTAIVGQQAPEYVVPRTGVVDLTSHLTPEGKLDWDVPPGQWTILRLGQPPIGCVNHPAPPGGVGLECDKLSPLGAEAHWAGMMQKVVDGAGPLTGKTLTTVLMDNYEVNPQNWTEGFREAFRRRRGYDLGPYLPTLSNRIVESPEITERFLWDYRRTVAELFNENYYGQMARLAHRNGMQIAIEGNGQGQFDDLTVCGMADIPLGEFWAPGDTGGMAPTCKMAASAAHIYGRRLVASEAYTSEGKWQDSLPLFKRGGDIIFCFGVNRFLFSSFAMQPWLDQAPGMTFGKWGAHLERTITWWEQGKSWRQYVTRCQYLLQQGTFVADFCLFGGEDYAAGLKIPPKPAIPAGCDYDLCDRPTLLGRMTVKKGCFALPSGMRYRFLVLPDARTLTLSVVKKLRALVKAGGTVIGPKPQFSPTLENYPACEAEIRTIAEEVWGDCDGKTVKEHRYGQGRVVWGKSYNEVLAEMSLPPDFEATDVKPKATLNMIHRRSPEADWYFVANSEKVAVDAVCAFRVTGKQPEFWYPDSGKIKPAGEYRIENGRTLVPMRFDPYGSVFVVFRKPLQETDATVRSGRKNWQEFAPVMELAGPWEVSFDPQWFYGSDGRRVTSNECKVVFEKLDDWSKRPEEAVKYFSGTAIYRKIFDTDVSRLTSHVSRLFLDLGRVEAFAEVEVNGKNLGVLWKPPFRVEISEAVKAGPNTLVVKVTNLWPNRLIGDERLPADCEYGPEGNLKAWPKWLVDKTPRTSGRRTFTTWRHWKATDPLLPSGLLGPARLVATSQTTGKPE